MESWGWRLPFLITAIPGIIVPYLQTLGTWGTVALLFDWETAMVSDRPHCPTSVASPAISRLLAIGHKILRIDRSIRRSWR